jgi:hypothetical protein
MYNMISFVNINKGDGVCGISEEQYPTFAEVYFLIRFFHIKFSIYQILVITMDPISSLYFYPNIYDQLSWAYAKLTMYSPFQYKP